MYLAVKSSWPLFLGIGLLMLGNGLQGTLLGVRASIEEFPTTITGIVMSGFYLGFLFGSVYTPKILQKVGHVRVFAAFASLASTTTLMHVVFIDPIFWGVMRLVSGFCYAGLYIVCESWLNDSATNETRGQVLSVYMLIVMAAMIGGQALLNIADPAGFVLFVVISALVSLALIPTALTANPAPQFDVASTIKLRKLFSISPLGITGMFTSGVVAGAFLGMAAVYGDLIGLKLNEIAIFVAVMILGGAILQWPIGRVSDLFDRRKVLMFVAMGGGVAAILTIMGAESGEKIWFFAGTGLFGGFAMPLYSLCIAHTNDHLQPDEMVGASSALILVNGAGAIFGPLIVAGLMAQFGSNSFFAFMGVALFALGSFALIRMYESEMTPLEDQGDFVAMPLRGGTVAAAMMPESEEWDEEPEEITDSSEEDHSELLEDGPTPWDTSGAE
jgi:MFS family permease